MLTTILLSIIVAVPTALSYTAPRAILSAVLHQRGSALKLVPNRITLKGGKSAGTFVLNLPREFAISVAAEGLKRVRFMARSPDGRIFVTDMYNLTDNNECGLHPRQFEPA